MSKRILFFVDRMLTGGIQKLLFDLSVALDKNKIEPEFLLLDDGNTYDLEYKLQENGCKIYKLKGIWLRKPHDFFAYWKAVDDFFSKHHDYAAVHMNSGPKNYYVLKCAHKYGIPIRIAHSHNTDYQVKSGLQKIIGNICKYPLKKHANVYLACSDKAAEWMFGEKTLKSGRVQILYNGVDIDNFAFNKKLRDEKRQELNIEDRLVIGNVGRFSQQKNHIRLIEIFAEVYKRNKKSVLLLAGAGTLESEAKQRAKELEIADNVMFLGFRTDANELMQAMDVYVMPSLYEGFPVTGVEAQVSGLPCVFSDTITREANLSENTKYISLNDDNVKWAEVIIDLSENSDRTKAKERLKAKGLDIKDMAKTLENIYFNEDI